ncbi:MAG: hypothetical protein ACE5K9_04910 [Candidatus Methylomirabilales bacterium]
MTASRRVILIFLMCLAPLPGLAATSPRPFPFEALDENAKEKVEALLNDYTLKRSLHSEHPIVNRGLHQFLLDRPDVGAAISRSLGIGNYTITRVGPDLFHGHDPDGVEGDMEILYRNEADRVYYAEGIAEGALITVRGKTMIFQESRYRKTDQGQMWVKTQITIYAKIENPVLAFFIKLFAPLIGQMVDPKISKAQGVVRQVNELMVQDPQETYRRIAESGELSTEDLDTLRKLMAFPEASGNATDRFIKESLIIDLQEHKVNGMTVETGTFDIVLARAKK